MKTCEMKFRTEKKGSVKIKASNDWENGHSKFAIENGA